MRCNHIKTVNLNAKILVMSIVIGIKKHIEMIQIMHGLQINATLIYAYVCLNAFLKIIDLQQKQKQFNIVTLEILCGHKTEKKGLYLIMISGNRII